MKKSPQDNKFHIGAKDGKHYWLTPKDTYRQLDDEFHFDFDPAPYPKPNSFDGLTANWGQSCYLNPPFGSIMHDGKCGKCQAVKVEARADDELDQLIEPFYREVFKHAMSVGQEFPGEDVSKLFDPCNAEDKIKLKDAILAWSNRQVEAAVKEAKTGWIMELPDLPYFQVKCSDESDKDIWFSPIYDTKRLPAELKQGEK